MKPGLSTATRPAVYRLSRLTQEAVYHMEQLHERPVAEKLTATAIAIIRVYEQTVDAMQSIGLDIDDVERMIAISKDDAEEFHNVLSLIRGAK